MAQVPRTAAPLALPLIALHMTTIKRCRLDILLLNLLELDVSRSLAEETGLEPAQGCP